MEAPLFDADRVNHGDATLELVAVLRGIEDENDVTVIFHVGAVDKATAYIGDEGLKQRMGEAGVTSAPDINFSESV